MFRNLLFALLVLSLLAAPLAQAQDAKPTVAILRYGTPCSISISFNAA